MADFRPDVVHLHTISEFGAAALRATGTVPTVLTVHGPEEYTLQLLPWQLPPGSYRHGSYRWSDLKFRGRLRYLCLRLVQRRLYVQGFRHVDTFLAPSRLMAAALRADAGESRSSTSTTASTFPWNGPSPGPAMCSSSGAWRPSKAWKSCCVPWRSPPRDCRRYR